MLRSVFRSLPTRASLSGLPKQLAVTISQLMRACGRAVHDLQHSRSGLVSDKALDHSSHAVNRVLHSAHALTIT